MPRQHSIAASVVVIAAIGVPAAARAQMPSPPIVMIAGAEAAIPGRVHGSVRDSLGRALADASIFAVGPSVVAGRSDTAGKFSLTLPAGDYILRASRDGYVSTYRESVRIQSSGELERHITLTAQDPRIDAALPHAHTEMAWRLRHLVRSVLRDGHALTPDAARFERPDVTAALSGELNLVTTTVGGPVSAWVPAVAWPRGVAFLTLGAPVEGYGAWNVKAALGGGDRSSWNVLGEYAADAGLEHAWKIRVSYSAQGFTRASDAPGFQTPEERTVAGVAASDRWQIMRGLEIAYGARAERFDYLVDPHLLSLHAGIRLQLHPLTSFTVRAARDMVAPGADEFLPPPAGTDWLPAEHTFGPLSSRRALRAEQVRSADVRLAQRLGTGRWSPTIHVRGLRQQTIDQMATIFGLPGAAGRDVSDQYAIAPLGDVDTSGWAIGASADLAPDVSGRVEYARVYSVWDRAVGAGIRRVSTSLARPDAERVHDMTASIEARLPRSATRVSVVYRWNTAFAQGERIRPAGPGSRFHVQVEQALPFRPTRTSRVDLVFSIRNLFRDARGDSSWYDELLTVAPPMRFMGGLQVRF